jgi:hypothetical protein
MEKFAPHHLGYMHATPKLAQVQAVQSAAITSGGGCLILYRKVVPRGTEIE